MNASEYKALRQWVGTQEEVANLLGVHPMTVSKRERGIVEVDEEAAIALKCLAEHRE